MAKLKKPSPQLIIEPTKKIKPWASNKIAEARKLGEHRTARAARRWGAPAGVALLILLSISSFFTPKDSFQQAKDELLRNSHDLQAQITLAEELLNNNQFEEAEKTLLLIQNQMSQPDNQVLGEQTSPPLEELWQRKLYSDPKEIKRLITAWEKIVEEKPDYRDGYLHLAYLHYKLYENDEAKDYLDKAIKLDPNHQLTKEMEKRLSN